MDKLTAESVAGNHTLAILKIGEDYFDLVTVFHHTISKEIKDLSHITINGKRYMIEYSFGSGGDWKFLAVVCGLNAANAEYSCVWCKYPSNDRWNMTKKWSISDTTEGARTIEDIESLSKQPAKKNFGCIKIPIFP